MTDEPRPPVADPSEWPIGRLLTAAARMLECAFDADIAVLGVTHAGVRVLDALAAGPLSQHQLAERCQVRDQTLSRIIDGLERAGHVTRQRDVQDRRRVLVRQTSTGECLLDQARRLAAARLDLFTEAPDDTAACQRVLARVVKRLGDERGR